MRPTDERPVLARQSSIRAGIVLANITRSDTTATRMTNNFDQIGKTPLFDWHVAHGGRMVDFAGWAMPVQYSSIIDEHNATRSGVGMTDVSHMGRLRFEGPGAAVFLAELLTR